MKIRQLCLRFFLVVLIILTLGGCYTAENKTDDRNISTPVAAWQAERDDIGMLAAYSVVYKGWQPDNARGYNIGSVLLDNTSKDGRLVFWGRNSNTITQNETQHGEVRLMLGYLAKLHAAREEKKEVPNIKTLKGYTVYTTLEPCAQCSGMMTLQNIYRTVYGQKDPGFGDALERLELDSSALENGYKPYPRPVISVRSNISYCRELEEQYSKYKASEHITDFLKSGQAKYIFKSAYDDFMSYEAKNKENIQFLEEAKKLVNSVPKDFVPLNPEI